MEQALETIEDVKGTVGTLDPTLPADSEEFMAGVCLLASMLIGLSSIRIARFTGYPLPFVKELSRNWRQQGVWKGKRRAVIGHRGWDDEEFGGIAFWADVLISLGYVERTPA